MSVVCLNACIHLSIHCSISGNQRAPQMGCQSIIGRKHIHTRLDLNNVLNSYIQNQDSV